MSIALFGVLNAWSHFQQKSFHASLRSPQRGQRFQSLEASRGCSSNRWKSRRTSGPSVPETRAGVLSLFMRSPCGFRSAQPQRSHSVLLSLGRVAFVQVACVLTWSQTTCRWLLRPDTPVSAIHFVASPSSDEQTRRRWDTACEQEHSCYVLSLRFRPRVMLGVGGMRV